MSFAPTTRAHYLKTCKALERVWRWKTMSKSRLQSLVEMHLREQTKLEMDENVFTILNEILEEDFQATLQVTRASVGAKIVAVIKERE